MTRNHEATERAADTLGCPNLAHRFSKPESESISLQRAGFPRTGAQTNGIATAAVRRYLNITIKMCKARAGEKWFYYPDAQPVVYLSPRSECAISVALIQ